MDASAQTFHDLREHPLPAEGRVRSSIFTRDGVRAAEADHEDLMSQRGDLLPLFAAVQESTTGFRRYEEQGLPNEDAYLNCLLIALARGNGLPATLSEGAPLPDPTAFMGNARVRHRIEETGFDYGSLDAKPIIRTVLLRAGFRWYRFGQEEGRFWMEGPEEEATSKLWFRARRRKDGGRTEIEVIRAPGPASA